MVPRARNARWMRAVLAVLGLAVPSAPGLARAGDPAAARELLKRGYLLAQEGKCDQAVALYDESLRLDVKAITLINVADCEERLGKLGSALGHWVDARARAKIEGNSAVETEAERRAQMLEPRLARLTVALKPGTPDGSTVLRDDVVLGPVSLGIEIPVDPGLHTVTLRAPDHQGATLEVVLAEGEAKRIELGAGPALAPPPSVNAASVAKPPQNRSRSPLVWVGFGVGAAGLVTGAVTGLMAMSRATDVARACPDRACPDEDALARVSGGRTLGDVSTVAFLLGAAGIAVGGTALLLGGGSRSPRAGASSQPLASVRFAVGPSSAALAGTF